MTAHELIQRLSALEGPLQIEGATSRRTELRQLVEDPALWSDQERAVALTGELANLEKLLTQWQDIHELLGMGEELGEQELSQLALDVAALEQRALLSGPHDANGAILTIHAGTGGTDAQDWASLLERMYLRYIEQGKTEASGDQTLAIDRRGWQVEVLERNAGEEAGIKRVTLAVKGGFSYGLLKSEAGVHRLVRLSPFNAKNLRQTSFALVEVLPQIDRAGEVAINDADLQIDVFRSGGAGGQHVNTTDSAVRLTHLPTGLTVTVQNERSQHQNKAKAMQILEAKLARLAELKSAEEVAILKGEFREGTWGNQIRSYVMQPYQLVKDHRNGVETAAVQTVLDGDLKPFIEAQLSLTIPHG
jgi:peptide chain release factor 2